MSSPAFRLLAGPQFKENFVSNGSKLLAAVSAWRVLQGHTSAWHADLVCVGTVAVGAQSNFCGRRTRLTRSMWWGAHCKKRW